MARLNDSQMARTNSTSDAGYSMPVQVISFTEHVRESTHTDEDQYEMTDCDHALMERILLEMRQRSEV